MTNFEFYKTKKKADKAYRNFVDDYRRNGADNLGMPSMIDWLYEKHYDSKSNKLNKKNAVKKNTVSNENKGDFKKVYSVYSGEYWLRDCDSLSEAENECYGFFKEDYYDLAIVERYKMK